MSRITRVTLEEKKEQILKFITDYVQKNNYPPTVREICKEFDFKSTSSVHGYLDKLRKERLISSEYDKPRTLKIENERYKTKKDMVSIKEEEISITFSLDKSSLAILNQFCNINGFDGDEGIKYAIHQLKI
jgi:SOS-response transcriptional repressor LexA